MIGKGNTFFIQRDHLVELYAAGVKLRNYGFDLRNGSFKALLFAVFIEDNGICLYVFAATLPPDRVSSSLSPAATAAAFTTGSPCSFLTIA